jgi:hypothetical protein
LHKGAVLKTSRLKLNALALETKILALRELALAQILIDKGKY